MYIDSFLKLKRYCEDQNFKGWDPYDGLNSKIFQSSFFKKFSISRLIWIQFFKRSPINFRRLMLVPKQYNSKGIGLFLLAYCNLYNLAKNKKIQFIDISEVKEKIIFLSNLLLKLKNNKYSGACWGYNFDWQARRLFLFPKYTPTIVATSFCVEALLESYEITNDENTKKIALSSANFIINDLKRYKHRSGIIFSYSPLEGNNTVFNASLLGAKLLSLCYKYTKNKSYLRLAKQSITSACNSQNDDGSWVYGLLPVQSWIDSFHTGYNLEAIHTYKKISGDADFNQNLELGFDYYINNFFLNNGVPKYYHNYKYPIDIHCPGQLFVTLSKLGKYKKNKILADKVLNWTIKNMQDKKGFFYYQIKKLVSSKISYMRWSNAFMFNAFVFFLKEQFSDEL